MRIRGTRGTFTGVEGMTPWGWTLVEGVTKSSTSLPAQHLAAQQTYNHLDMSVGEALRQRTLCLEGVLSCQPEESLGEVIDRIVREQVARARHTPPQHVCAGPHEQLRLSPYIGHLPCPPISWPSLQCPHWPATGPVHEGFMPWATAS